jgi:hypothetical protein
MRTCMSAKVSLRMKLAAFGRKSEKERKLALVTTNQDSDNLSVSGSIGLIYNETVCSWSMMRPSIGETMICG